MLALVLLIYEGLILFVRAQPETVIPNFIQGQMIPK